MINSKIVFLILCTSFIVQCKTQENPEGTTPAENILEMSLQYHDPKNTWGSQDIEMNFVETRPGGEDRKTSVHIRNDIGYFRVRRPGEEHGMLMDSCFVISGAVDCDRVQTLRNYYLYLWGLPMKLRDPGTDLSDHVDTLKWNGLDVLALKASYDTDEWTFYFDRSDYALKGYQFVKNDGSGEWVELYNLADVGEMRIPSERRWYVLSDSTHLGTDVLLSASQRR